MVALFGSSDYWNEELSSKSHERDQFWQLPAIDRQLPFTLHLQDV